MEKHGVKRNDKFTIRGWTMPSACGKVPMAHWAPAINEYPHLADVPVPKYSKRAAIDIVLGTDYSGLLAVLEARRGKPRDPAAHLTAIGWYLFGDPGKGGHISNHKSYMAYKSTTVQKHEEDLEALAKMFTECHEGAPHLQDKRRPLMRTALEAKARGLSETTLEANKSPKKAQQEAEVVYRHDKDLHEKFVKKEYNATNRQFDSPQMQLEYDKMKIIPCKEGKGYQASIPWKMDPPPFRNNEKLVRKRQQGTLRSLHRHGINRDDVAKIFGDYEAKKYIERITKEQVEEDRSHLIPYFPVVNRSRHTTKIRLVFDCAAVYNGLSLNNNMYCGPNLLTNFLQILFRFRKFKYGFVSDISEMFLRTRLDPKDYCYHRFLFEDESGEIQHYQWLRTLFGGTAMPNVSQKVLHVNCELHGQENPDAAVTCTESTYMDDIIDSKTTEKEIQELIKQLVRLFDYADMAPKKMITNARSVLKDIPEADRAKEVSLINNELSLSEGKILGLIWDPDQDVFRLKGDPNPGGKTSKKKPKMKDGNIVWTLSRHAILEFGHKLLGFVLNGFLGQCYI